MMMRWLFKLLRKLFGSAERKKSRPELMSMYFQESNHLGRRKSNRDRA